MPQSRKSRIIAAALDTLKAEGYAGASARAIARRGGFNQALIFYHFGSLHGLLLAALDRTSEERMARYREAEEEAQNLEDLIALAMRIYREDLAGGHMTVISELIAGSMAHHELRPEIVARMEPWIDFAEAAIHKALAGSPLAEGLPTRDLAYALVAFYCGVNMLSNLEPDSTRIDALFEVAGRLAPVAAAVLGSRA